MSKPETQSEMKDYRLHNRLSFQLSRLAKHVEINLETGLLKHGITRLQWRVLAGVGIEDHRTPSDLARHVGVSRPCMSRTLKQMQTNQLIERLPIGGDGRNRALKLTEKGYEKMTLCWEQVQAAEEQFIGDLQPQQLQSLLDTINTLLDGETIELDAKARPKKIAHPEKTVAMQD